MGNLFIFLIPCLGFHFTLNFIFLLMSTELCAINLLFFENLRIQSECGKIQTRKTSNTDTFHPEEFPIWLKISVLSCHKSPSILLLFQTSGKKWVSKLSRFIVKLFTKKVHKACCLWNAFSIIHVFALHS